MKNSKRITREYTWIIRLITSVLLILLTVKFAVPLSLFVTNSSSSLFNGDTLSINGTVDIKNILFESKQTESETTEAESETTTLPQEETTQEELTSKTEIINSQYETPDDVLAFEQEYLAAFSQTTPQGNVSEVFFKTSGSTDSTDGIYIKNATSTKKPDFSELLKQGPNLSVPDITKPVVLIFHTHTTESYLLSDNGVFYSDYETRSTDKTKNMIRVGDEICKVLEENNIGYIHDETIYDESYEGAYSRSRVTVEKYLEEYPSIQIVLDVHRDAIYYSDTSHCKPTAEINGKKAAQIMIITGAQEGYITDFPNWEDNLRFALCFQKTAEDKYPGLMKPIYFCQRKYNMDTAKCSLLLEMGTDANTLDEAMYSGYLAGQVLSDIILKYQEG